MQRQYGSSLLAFVRPKKIWIIGIMLLVLIVSGCGAKSSESTVKNANTNETTATGESKQSSDSKADKPKAVRIGYQKGNTLSILKVKGNLEERLKEQNIAVEWKLFAGGDLVMEALTSGSIDFGHGSDGSGVFAQAGNQPFTYVANDHPFPEGMGIVVPNDSPIKEIKDLKGKKLGVAKGGNHHYLAVRAVEQAGLKLEDVKWEYITNASSTGRALFETKQIDALATWDPFFATIQHDLKPRTLTDGTGYSPNRTFYYSNVNFAKDHPDLVKIILEEIHKSDQWANTNKPEVIKLLSADLGIDEEIIALSINRRTFGIEIFTPEIIADQQLLADTYARIGLIDKPVHVGDLMPLDAPWNPNLSK